MAKVLITGATGFLGSNLAHRLSGSGNKVSIFTHGNSNLWRIKEIISRLDTHVVDLTNPEMVAKVVRKLRPDIVFHLATYGVYSYQSEYQKIIQTNVTGSINLMTASSNCDSVRKFVNVGSSFEYGPKLRKIAESERLEPDSIYGLSKGTQTSLAQYFARHRDLPAVTLRIFNAYGMFEEGNRLIPSIMLSALTGKPLHIRNPNEIRDFVFISDVVDSMIKASKIKKSGQVFNVGTSHGLSVEQLIKKSRRVTGRDIKVGYERGRLETHGRLVADISEARKHLGWRPKISIEDGLNETFRWFRQNIRLYDGAGTKN